MAASSEYVVNEANVRRAKSLGLVDADWYLSPVPRARMQHFVSRRDLPAIRDTFLWLGLLGASGSIGFLLWGSVWAVIPFAVYGVLFTSSSDSRWHETLHGTAFATDWMNNALYEVAAFMVCRESTPWRWSHMRHHSDTYIKGVDPEITLRRPPTSWDLFAIFSNIKHVPREYRNIMLHAFGGLAPGEEHYVPKSQHRRMFMIARVYVAIYATVLCIAIYAASILPLMYVILPSFYGQWLLPVLGLPQHVAMAENTLDHRLNSRTVYMNPVFRFIYWNMNYHIEHHMYPMVPYHRLPDLHDAIKDDLPPTYNGIVDVYREILPAVRRQMKDADYFVDRRPELPKTKSRTQPARIIRTTDRPDADGRLRACSVDALEPDDVLRLDAVGRTFAIYCNSDGDYFATDGLCTHGAVHLAGGRVAENLIECPKHNGRFSIRDGSPQRHPACVALSCYPVENRGRTLYIDLSSLENPERRTVVDST